MQSKLIKFTLIFIAIGTLFLTISPIFLDKKKIVNVISKKLSEDLDIDLDFGEDPKLTFFPFPLLRVQNVDFKDDVNRVHLKVKELEVVSTWESLIKLRPNIKLIKLKSPTIKFTKKKVANKYLIFVKSNFDQNIVRFKYFLNRFKNLEIQNGRVEFYKANKLNVLEQLDLTVDNKGETIIKADFNYVNYKSFFKLVAKTKDLINVDYSLNQLFKNKNEVFGSGQITVKDNEIMILGNFKSENLNLMEVTKLIAQFRLHSVENIHRANLVQPNVKFNVNLEIDKMLINKISLNNITSNFVSADNKIFLKDLRANYLDTIINANAIYLGSDKKVKGKISVYDFLVKKDMMGASKFYLKDASFDCDLDFIIDTRNNKKLLNKIYSKGDCIAPSAVLVGISIGKIAERLDNLETFQDFFDLFNKNKMAGETNIDSINLSFKLKDSTFLINNLTALQKNFKISSTGAYSIYSDVLNLKNDISIKTKKYTNLPSFSVLVNGRSKDYKLSYDFEKIKSAVLSDGINAILKNKKKIVIDPRKFKNLIDKNSKEFNPEKIIDLFLN